MTLKEFLIYILENFEEEDTLYKQIGFFVKDNPDGTFNAISIQSIGISEEYILLAHKCPNCED